MKKILYIIWTMFAFLAVTFSACEQDGWDKEKLYIEDSFKPVYNVNGVGSFGRAMFTWDLPDSTSTLNMIEVKWTSDSIEGNKIFSRYIDSVWIYDLKGTDYTFEIISLGENGEEEIAQMNFEVIDNKKEPAADVENFSTIPAINFLFLDWDHPNDPNYNGVKFEIYKIKDADTVFDRGILVRKEESSKYEFELDLLTSYVLQYYSINQLDSPSESKKYFFKTGDTAPEVPEIKIDYTNSDIYDFCHSAEIRWTSTADMDSILIKFIGLGGEEYSYKFGGENGYLTPLPGGIAKLAVQARGTNGSWSLPESQVITTKLTEETTHLDHDGSITTDKRNLTAWCIGESLGYSDARTRTEYSFQDLAGMTKLNMKYSFKTINELELCVNLEELYFVYRTPDGYNPDPTHVTVEDYRRLVSRLPKLKIMTVDKNWPHDTELLEEFKNHPRIKLILK